ncbi:MAG TPA: hypothetical protein VHB25_01115 [Gemmatimonadaceae bacterium]|nr:hypothetical protein [Gemmatimonadaceae bacterium]
MTALARASRRWAAAAVIAAGGGCVSIHAPPFMRPAPERQWPATLQLAQQRAQERQFDAADSLLADFAARYPGSAPAVESSYWRALYKMDPANPHASLSTAVAALDAYIGSVQSAEHASEAETLRRIAGQLVNLNKLAASAMTAPKDQASQPADAKPNPDQPSAADAEIRRLRDELAKANAELDRIKRRLAQPPGKPPR